MRLSLNFLHNLSDKFKYILFIHKFIFDPTKQVELGLKMKKKATNRNSFQGEYTEYLNRVGAYIIYRGS